MTSFSRIRLSLCTGLSLAHDFVIRDLFHKNKTSSYVLFLMKGYTLIWTCYVINAISALQKSWSKNFDKFLRPANFVNTNFTTGVFPGNFSEIVTLFLKTLWSHFKGINERYQGNEFNYMQQNWSSVLDENIYIRCPISISIFWKGNESVLHTWFYSF